MRMGEVVLTVQHHAYPDLARYADEVASGRLRPAGVTALTAAWQVTTGPLNRGLILHDVPVRPAAVEPSFLRDEHHELLEEIKPYAWPGDWARLYEFRIYTLHRGLADRFAGLMRDVLPAREKYSPNIGTWRPRSGNPDRILHMWAYHDLAERDGLRPSINADPAWQQYVRDVTPLIADMESMLLAPIPLKPA
jgi:NIPSNAP